MPESTAPQTPNFDDLTFDSLFETTNPGNPTQSQTSGEVPAGEPQTPSSEPPAAPATQSPANAQPEPYLRTPTGTVYYSKEEAERGYAEKDRVIEQTRAWGIAMTGYDPVTGKPVRVGPQEAEVNYATNPEKFYADLAAANNSTGADKGVKYAQVMQKWQSDTLAPYMPVISQSAKAIAVQNLTKQNPGFSEFYNSQKYNDYVASNDILDMAIKNAENDPRLTPQLEKLLSLAYDAANGRNISQVIQQSRTNTAPNPQAQVPVRPTLTPSTPSLPSSQANVAPSLATPEGRKAILERGRAAGLQNMMGDTVFRTGGA